VYFEVIGRIRDIEVIAVGGKIREIVRLQKQFGRARWRKLKGGFDSPMVQSELPRFTGMKHTESANGS
jgi:hypothetical protein